MRTSQFFFTTLKEAPSDAEVISHQLMLRAGFIKRAASGHLHLDADWFACLAQGRKHCS